MKTHLIQTSIAVALAASCSFAVAQTAAPYRAGNPVMEVLPVQPYGSRLFTGQFKEQGFVGVNPSYVLSPGDKVRVRFYGGFSSDEVLTIDPAGNVFLPKIGPVRLQGQDVGNLQRIIETSVQSIYRAGVSVYATLEGAQNVRVYVTGGVPAPGLYAGQGADSVLRFLDKAGGITPGFGAYTRVSHMRGGRELERLNLYGFLSGKSFQATHQFQDGDTVVVANVGDTVKVTGVVGLPSVIELDGLEKTVAAAALNLVGVGQGATHVRHTRQEGTAVRVQVLPLAQAYETPLRAGDALEVLAEVRDSDVTVRVTGAHMGAQTIAVRPGETLAQLMKKLTYRDNAAGQVQLFRASVAQRQAEMLEASLRQLERLTFTASSSTREESELRKAEADAMLRFIESARKVKPAGQMVLPEGADLSAIVLEEGDEIRVPAVASTVSLAGEVRFPLTTAWQPGATIQSYLRQAGGVLRDMKDCDWVVTRQDGSADVVGLDFVPRRGDTVFAIPRLNTKSLEVSRGISEVLFRVAFIAKVAFGL